LLCPNCSNEMREMLQQGVLIDFCPSCKGVWLDGGEINYFVRNPMPVNSQLKEGLIGEQESQRICPRCQKPMTVGGLLDPGLEINHCRICDGLWFDVGELPELDKLSGKKTLPRVERLKQAGMSAAALAAGSGLGIKLPSLALRSLSVLFFLYGIVFALFFAMAEIFKLPVFLAFLMVVAFAVIQFFVSPYVMDLILSLAQGANFIKPEERDKFLPLPLINFIQRQADANKIPFPTLAVIEDGNPNAFTYGHTPKNARVVITRGLITLLEQDELEAVVAHEIGHAIHWDMLIMTAAMVVPAFLYMVFRIGFQAASGKGKSSGKRGGQLILFSIVAYVLYIVSQYIVLFLSRTREFYADRYSGVATDNPNALARALVKIAYGLAGGQKPEESAEQEQSSGKILTGADSAVQALGIFNPGSARALAAVAVGVEAKKFSAENLLGAMQWDLWNPWASWYELNSTHPLPAKRLDALGKQAMAMGQKPMVLFDLKKPESYWDEFFADLLMYLMPAVLTVAFCAPYVAMDVLNRVFSYYNYVAPVLIGLGLGFLFRVLFSYRTGGFPAFKVSGLLKNVKVSGIRPVPATLRGTVIGRGVPGLIWSDDLVLQDETGFIFLDYRQPLRILEFMFGLFRTPEIIGKKVAVKGWYRRCPMPYLEMKQLMVGGEVSNCYVYHIKIIISLALVAFGAVFLWAATGMY